MKRPFKMYVIHHSHTDIGYTDRQEKIEAYHVDFIKQAIELCEAEAAGNGDRQGFRWTCETFWAVERFLEQAGADWVARFEGAVASGRIELSGSYLHMTELIDTDIMERLLRRATDYGKSIGVKVDSAMHADINGFSWGYAQSLLNAGIDNLFTCIHTHHGMFPLGRKQMPFWWETAKGERLLVWNGDHYHLGNDLGLSPNALLSYSMREDGLNVYGADERAWEVAEQRIQAYVACLEEEGYPYPFVPIMVSGLIWDNAPPNAEVTDFVERWNRRHGHQIELEMTTLHEFFRTVRETETQLGTEIPVYRGDWPDWWSDGVASTAMHTQLFRDAQRTLRVVKALDPQGKQVQTAELTEMEYNLAMYAEHTWGYHTSVGEPWNPFVQSLGARKEQFASEAHQRIYRALDQITVARGEKLMAPNRALTYKVINPAAVEVADIVQLPVDQWEVSKLLKKGFTVVESATGKIMPYETVSTSRGYMVCISAIVPAHSEQMYEIKLNDGTTPAPAGRLSNTRLRGLDGVHDIPPLAAGSQTFDPAFSIDAHSISSPYVRIEWAEGEGIVKWHDRVRGLDLIDPSHPHRAFTPIYEVTPVDNPERMRATRTAMGRNRKGLNVQRHTGKLQETKRIAEGVLSSTVELIYGIQGMSHYSVLLTVHHTSPRVDVAIRMHKDSIWEPENVYIALPFRAPSSSAKNSFTWLDKSGTPIRPWIDQLPGTLADFYCIQEGLALVAPDAEAGLAIATPDTPLIQCGPLQHEARLVMGHDALQKRSPVLYAWVLNNFWETNFKATVGGFYEFRYKLTWGEDAGDPSRALAWCRNVNTGLLTFRAEE
ncbi:glycoside hydrolase [Paenibacillus cisolokensis]|uniref:glycoside hydrolase family 38 N-terminal domain-containing protein n=1 Tax=Paenibacillus cisolokensis TaxID=1658519 RepID=UPI003D29E58A